MTVARPPWAGNGRISSVIGCFNPAGGGAPTSPASKAALSIASRWRSPNAWRSLTRATAPTAPAKARPRGGRNPAGRCQRGRPLAEPSSVAPRNRRREETQPEKTQARHRDRGRDQPDVAWGVIAHRHSCPDQKHSECFFEDSSPRPATIQGDAPCRPSDNDLETVAALNAARALDNGSAGMLSLIVPALPSADRGSMQRQRRNIAVSAVAQVVMIRERLSTRRNLR